MTGLLQETNPGISQGREEAVNGIQNISCGLLSRKNNPELFSLMF